MRLGLILVLGTLARVPGLFWGFHFFGTETVILHPDEPPYTLGRHEGTGYPRGLEVHVRVLTWVLDSLGLASVTGWEHYGFFVGRALSLLYGLLTLVVLYGLARAFFKSEGIGLLAAFFLALADLHVTYSHMGIPDSAATFWFYAALASAHTALERGSRRAFLLSAVCTGAAAAMRYQSMSLLPAAWWVARSRRRVLNGLLLLLTVSGAFFLFSGLASSPPAIVSFLARHAGWGTLGLKKFVILPPVYLAVILVGVGLPVFVLAGYGLFRFLRAKWTAHSEWRDLLADDQIPICLAPLAAFLQLSAVALWAPRHAVVLIPFVAMLAAYGFTQLPYRALGPLSAQTTARGLLTVIGLYLAVQVASVQIYFVDDPLEKAGRWLRAHVPRGELLSTFLAKVPPEYPKIAEWKANYLILSARGYGRYLFKDFLPSHLTGRFPTAEEVFAGNPESAVRLRELFSGELPYRLIKTIRLRFYTPELLLTHRLWYPPPHLYEVLIYERRRERERQVELITPARTDYLVTLNTGTHWRLDPGQWVRLSLNDHPLAAPVGEGLTHLLLPQSLVTSPHSQLQLSSNLLLPHLPVDLVKRIRPLGDEFVVESLLDEDLMPEGFYRSEVRADGATSRWTNGAGQVLLPGPGVSKPWKRLAVHLEGRPSGSASLQPVVFFVNSKKVGEAAISREESTVELPIPADAFTRDIATLQIIAPTWKPSETSTAVGAKRLGVAVYWVRLSRAEQFPPFSHRIQFQWFRHRVETVSFPSGSLTLRGDLFVPASGGRSAIVLAHGASPLGRKHGLYLGLARRLAERGHWVLNPDLRGYGESDDPSRIASPSDLDFTQDLVSALTFLQQRLGVKDVTVVGHSFGAGVALAVAARDSRVARVAAISPGRRAHELILSSLEGKRGIRDRMISEMGLREEQFPVELVESVVVPIIIDTYADHPFRQPLLLIDGEREEAADLLFLRNIYRRMKGEKAYVTIPNADHYFGVERQVEERDVVALGSLADVIDGWIREGARWSRHHD